MGIGGRLGVSLFFLVLKPQFPFFGPPSGGSDEVGKVRNCTSLLFSTVVWFGKV